MAPIVSFADSRTESFFVEGRTDKGVKWSHETRTARRKLDILNFAVTLTDLAAPPGNRLEALAGDLEGFHSIRINDQWRIVFVWTERRPDQVRIVDYH